MILPVECIPTIIGIHEHLPPLKEVLQISEFPTTRLKLIIFAMVNVNMFEIEDHIDLIAVKLHRTEHLFLVSDERHLANTEGIVLLENLADTLEVLVQARAIGVPLVTPLPGRPRVLDRCIGEALFLANEVDHVHAEPVAALVEPESHDIVHGLADWGVFPVEVGLLDRVQMQVVFLGQFVPLPGAT